MTKPTKSSQIVATGTAFIVQRIAENGTKYLTDPRSLSSFAYLRNINKARLFTSEEEATKRILGCVYGWKESVIPVVVQNMSDGSLLVKEVT